MRRVLVSLGFLTLTLAPACAQVGAFQLNNQGVALYKQQQYEGAEALFRRALDLTPDSQLRSRIINNLAITLEKQGKKDPTMSPDVWNFEEPKPKEPKLKGYVHRVHLPRPTHSPEQVSAPATATPQENEIKTSITAIYQPASRRELDMSTVRSGLNTYYGSPGNRPMIEVASSRGPVQQYEEQARTLAGTYNADYETVRQAMRNWTLLELNNDWLITAPGFDASIHTIGADITLVQPSFWSKQLKMIDSEHRVQSVLKLGQRM